MPYLKILEINPDIYRIKKSTGGYTILLSDFHKSVQNYFKYFEIIRTRVSNEDFKKAIANIDQFDWGGFTTQVNQSVYVGANTKEDMALLILTFS